MKNIKYFLLLGSLLLVSIAKAADETDVSAIIEKASKACDEVTKLGFEWTATRGLIDSAKEALQSGNSELATKLANRALKQAENGIKQAEYSDKHWLDNVPE